MLKRRRLCWQSEPLILLTTSKMSCLSSLDCALSVWTFGSRTPWRTTLESMSHPQTKPVWTILTTWKTQRQR